MELRLFKPRIIDLPEAYRPQIEEMPGDLRRIAEEIEAILPQMGVRLTLILAQIFPGQDMYMRSAKEVLAAARDRMMRDHYDAPNSNITAKDLATQTGLSLGHVEKILGRVNEVQESKQLNLWER